MNERLAAGVLAGISAALIASESLLAALYGFDAGLILFCLALYAGAAGILFSLRILLGERQGIETVSMRRARAMQHEGAGARLEGYGVDEEFLDGGGRRKPKPTAEKASSAGSPGRSFSSPGGSSGGDDELKASNRAQASSPVLNISLDRADFDSYIKRSMSEGEASADGGEGGFSIGLDTAGFSGRSAEPPVDFSHDPKAVFARLKRDGGRR